jgi:hypothetical protein
MHTTLGDTRLWHSVFNQIVAAFINHTWRLDERHSFWQFNTSGFAGIVIEFSANAKHTGASRQSRHAA